jgi:hypothetical protein
MQFFFNFSFSNTLQLILGKLFPSNCYKAISNEGVYKKIDVLQFF